MSEVLASHPSCNPLCRVCHYKDLPYEIQLDKKNRWARGQLAPWKAVLADIRPSPAEERIGYRTKSWMRRGIVDGQVSFGMLRSVKIDGCWEKEFVSWDSCPLHTIEIQKMIVRLREALRRESPGFLENALAGVWIGSPHLVLVSRERDSTIMDRLDWNAILVPPFDRAWFHCNPQVGRKAFGHHPILPAAAPGLEQPEHPGQVHPVRAFRQVARSLLQEARALATRSLLEARPALVLDLYCGTGDLALSLPADTGWVGIEFSRDAVNHASTLRTDGPVAHAAFVGGVEQRLHDPRVLARIRAATSYSLFVNPPRSGLTEEARARLFALFGEKPPLSISYLSCSASSLARDLSAFQAAGYGVRLLQPYDFFPQTEHFETLALLTPGATPVF